MSDVVRFKYQRLLKCLPEGQWLTTADYFALVPRALIRHPWLAHRNLEILAERNLIIADKTTKPMKWLKPISTIGHA